MFPIVLRLRVERQVGYKSMKFLTRIAVTEHLDDGGDKGNPKNPIHFGEGLNAVELFVCVASAIQAMRNEGLLREQFCPPIAHLLSPDGYLT